MLTLVLPKGRILEEAIKLFMCAGYVIPRELNGQSRKLVLKIPEEQIALFLAKPMDVPTYVEYGVADVGIVGKDVLMEEQRNVYELMDLHISPCRLSIAGLKGQKRPLTSRVATKYPKIAQRYFKEQGEQVEVIRLNGSIELAPLMGLADRIVDIVSTGRTLKENGLVELKTIAHITSRLIANPASYRMKSDVISNMCERMEAVVVRGGVRQ